MSMHAQGRPINIKRYWLEILISFLAGLMFIIANMTPQESLFIQQDRVDKMLIFLLGGVYLGARALPIVLGLLIVVIVVFTGVMVVKTLVRDRRWPTLLPVALLLAANCAIFSTSGLVLSRSIGDPIMECEYYVTGRVGIRMIRYPMDIRLDYAEQQFFLITEDSGSSWRQFLQTFAYEPRFANCENIQFTDAMNGFVRLERSNSQTEVEVITYTTSNGGQSWQEETISSE